MDQCPIVIMNFSIGLPKKMRYEENKELTTGICKQPVNEAYLSVDGFRGDDVADKKNHGGSDRAVCVYPFEHYSLWEKEFETTLPVSAFGENITVTNMQEKDVHIGDIFQLGNAVIQITQGRIPCSTINKRNNNPYLLKRMIDTGYTGYLCRVLEEGSIQKDSKVKLLEKHRNEVSVLFGNLLYFHRPNDIEGMKRVLEVDALANNWREKLQKRLNRFKN